MDIAKAIADPRDFRTNLRIDANGTSKPLGTCLDQWQRADFEALDPGWARAALGDVAPPARLRAYLERPRGHSKTNDLAVMVTWALLRAPTKISGIAAAADRDQAKLLRDGVDGLCRLNPWLGRILKVDKFRISNALTGSELDIISNDTASSWGPTPHFIVVDELTHWPDAGEALWHSLLSSAAKRGNCVLVIISNAGVGMGVSWQWNLREAVRNDSAWHFSRLEGPQASWITAAQLDEQRRLLPSGVFARLWLNEWTSGLSDALTEADVRAAIKLSGPQDEPVPGWHYIAGLDLGLTHDSACLAVVARSKLNHALAYCKEWRPPRGGRVSLDEIERTILEQHDKFHFRKVAADPWQAAQIVERLQKRHVPIFERVQSGANLTEQCMTLLEVFNSQSIALYDFPPLINDLLRLRVEERSYGYRLVSERGPNGHGDRASALSIALAVAKEIPFKHFAIGVSTRSPTEEADQFQRVNAFLGIRGARNLSR